jgi:hypothetical protein
MPKPTPINVNLVFHGVFAFVLNRDSVEVLFPFFSPHQYLFGPWHPTEPVKHFEPMPKGEIELSGISGIRSNKPRPDFPTHQVPAVYGHRERCDDNLFCTLKLSQYPKSVHGFREYTRPSDNSGKPIKRFPFGGIHGSGLSPSALAGPMVLCYQAKSADDVNVNFRGRTLNFERIASPDGKALNLHFFAEGENDLPAEGDMDRPAQVSVHYQEVWRRLTGMISGLDVRLAQLWPFVISSVKQPPNDTGIEGLPKQQLAELDELSAAVEDPDTYGGDHSDCEKAHILIDNRTARAGAK